MRADDAASSPAPGAGEATEPDDYPPSPSGPLPPSGATTRYTLQVILVLISLLAFLGFYLALLAGTAWLFYASVAVVAWASGKAVVFNLGLVAGSGMLFLFFLKGLFHRRRFDDDHLIRVRKKDQPRLFAFLERLASEAGSRLPGRVYLSHDVNAAVMYPRSMLALVWPVRKNLVLGLGLVNALDVSELKAVLAHEFGHFSQASMRLGTYVYIANRVITDLVHGRDLWDDALRAWQRTDLRLSFPAWIIAGLVWVLRKILEYAHRGLTLAALSLGRQMEFNADANAVRLAGSDAIVSGLWKSERASLAFTHAVSGLHSVAEHGTFTTDLFFHQARSLERIDRIVGRDAESRSHFASVLKTYEPGAALHFQAGGEQVSTLWSTHPPHHEREASAKNIYVPSPPDTRSAWCLFVDTKRLRRDVTRSGYEAMGLRPREAEPARAVEERIEEERGEMRQADHYHGLYENRVVTPGDVSVLVAKIEAKAGAGELDVAAMRERAREYTGEALAEKMATLERLRGEESLIAALKGGAKLKSNSVEFRGEQRTAKEIVRFASEVRDATAASLADLKKADRRFFRYAYALARQDEAKRDELLARYRFLVGIQDLVLGLARFEPIFENIVTRLRARTEMDEASFRELCDVLGEARDSLASALSAARKLPRPALALLDGARSLDDFLLPEELVERFVGPRLEGAWLSELFQQHGAVLRRLRRLHFKNLGALLVLTEGLDPELFPRRASGEKDESDEQGRPEPQGRASGP